MRRSAKQPPQATQERPILVRYGPPLASGANDAGWERDSARVATAVADEESRRANTRDATEYIPAPPDTWSDRLIAALKGTPGQVLAIWGLSRVALLVYSLVAEFLALRHQDSITAGGWSAQAVLQLWERNDANWYMQIAATGYNSPGDTAFFPLYPLLISSGEHLLALIGITGTTPSTLLAMGISNVACLVAFLGLAKLALREFGDSKIARFAVLALAATPLAFFLGAAYTESLFLAFAVWGLWAMRQRYWYRAAGCVLLAGLCRSTGVILIAPLLYEFVRALRQESSLLPLARETARKAVAVVAAGPVGIGVFSAYCLVDTGDPLAWLHIETTYWRHATVPVWQGIHDVANHFLSFHIFSGEQGRELFVDLLPLMLVTILTVVLARRQPVAFTLYLIGLVYLTAASPIVVSAAQHYAIYDSAGRYMLPAVPIYLALGRWAVRFPRPFAVALVLALALQAGLAVYYLGGGPII